jgi:hypothetical protein
MVVGLVLIGAGIVVPSWAWAAPGLVILLVGGGLALHGGFFYDVQRGPASDQLRDVVHDDEHEFPDPSTKRTEDEVKRDVHRRWLGRRA